MTNESGPLAGNRVFLLILLNIAVILSLSRCNNPVKKTIQPINPALQVRPIPSGLGINIHFFKGNEQDYSMITKSGVDLVRMDASWEVIEKKPGVYNFRQTDRLVNDLIRHNLRLLFIICYGNPLYDQGLAPYTPEGRAASARFCEALVNHYAGKGILWELWNEPNADNFWKPKSNIPDYMSWCRAVVPAIRKADPAATIIAPAVSDFDIPFLESCFENGLLSLVDGISVHPYRNPKRGPETTYDEYENLKVLIDFYKPAGKNIPVISGEWGYSSYFVSDQIQGKYLARQWLTNMASDIPVSIWYDWHDDGPDSLNAEHNFGTVTYNYTPKPAYTAIKTLITQLRGYRFIARLTTPGDEDYHLLFSNGRKLKLVLWTTGTSHEIILDPSIKISRFITFTGDSVPAGGNPAIQIDEAPKYGDLAEPVPAYLSMLQTAKGLNGREMADAATFILGGSKSGSDFAMQLKTVLEKGAKPERMAAWEILTMLAKSMETNPASAVKLYDQILAGEAPDRSKKEALYRLAVIGSEESAAKVAPFLQSPEFAKAASVFYMQTSYHYAGEKKFTEALDALYRGTRATGLRYGAERTLRKMKEMGWKEQIDAKEMARQNGFITTWNLAGPFPNDETTKRQVSWFPEKGFNPSQTQQFGNVQAKWITVNVDNMWGIVPLAKMFGKKKLSMYAFTEIEQAVDGEAILKAGSNDGIECWINGRKVYENKVDRALTVDEDVFKVHLLKGKNSVLLKIRNSGGNWEFCLRVCDRNGVPLKSSSSK